mmetsp:Transcript_5792/g.24377  ORF Transcript_5792/g.24377 Transcript_5792/m.24377 type:complete len:238 (-) Transcript_5792:1947-2660(-)
MFLTIRPAVLDPFEGRGALPGPKSWFPLRGLVASFHGGFEGGNNSSVTSQGRIPHAAILKGGDSSTAPSAKSRRQCILSCYLATDIKLSIFSSKHIKSVLASRSVFSPPSRTSSPLSLPYSVSIDLRKSSSAEPVPFSQMPSFSSTCFDGRDLMPRFSQALETESRPSTLAAGCRARYSIIRYNVLLWIFPAFGNFLLDHFTDSVAIRRSRSRPGPLITCSAVSLEVDLEQSEIWQQ